MTVDDIDNNPLVRVMRGAGSGLPTLSSEEIMRFLLKNYESAALIHWIPTADREAAEAAWVYWRLRL